MPVIIIIIIIIIAVLANNNIIHKINLTYFSLAPKESPIVDFGTKKQEIPSFSTSLLSTIVLDVVLHMTR